MNTITDNIWFAYDDKRKSRLVPVNAMGWRVVFIFLVQMAMSGVAGFTLSYIGGAPLWLWLGIMVMGMFMSGMLFVMTAIGHSQKGITVSEYRKRNEK